MPVIGTVYLVGAGPGDPGLFTVAGAQIMRKADVVVYDRLVHPSLLKLAPPEADRIYVGKAADKHAKSQDEINATLVTQAARGQTVVRLKGGDPFVFGRGGEEAEYLREHDIPFVVVPGVTSAIAAAAYAGIPVTHRDVASSFAVITGHERDDAHESATRQPGQAEGRRSWEKIAGAADTLVFLMGVDSLSEIASKLIENGRSPATPVAVVQWATWAGRQQTVVGVLSDIVDRVRASGITAPAVTVIGEVVSLRDRIRWWDNRPLSGKRIVVTRAREQASSLVDVLHAEGAEPIEFPVIQIVPPPDHYAALDDALTRLESYEWVVFTSVNGVKGFWERLAQKGRDSRDLHNCKIAAIGVATSDALAEMGIRADFVPTVFTGEEVARQFPEVTGAKTVLVPRALEAGDVLPELLIERGLDVDMAAVYETVLDGRGADEVRARIEEGTVDIVTFTSSSTVKNFVTAMGPTPPSMAGIVLACIGPTTATTVRELFQREPDIIAEEYTIAGLVEALRKTYAAG
ncbi:MAG: uroporphyrinogen-III C-methyltransferase [Capsulimonadaceae bacterium]|nr:uroporphyrinogen-III C-methyltransferase [Capsulimonadaceae bacterium]